MLGTLEDKGWIGSDDSRPTKYFAKSPSTGIETTKQKMENDFLQNQSVILNELVPLYEKKRDKVKGQTFGYFQVQSILPQKF